MLPMFLVVALMGLVSGQMVNQACPMNCYCEDKLVECMSLMEFPTNLPTDTISFKTSQMNVRDIPPNAFSYLPDLEKIEFNNCNVQNLQGCSFKDLPVKEIRLIKTVVESIESYAFSGLKNVIAIEFNSCKIGRIKPFGFYEIHDLHMLTLYNTHIRNFYNQAMYNVSGMDRMVVTRSNLSDVVTGAFRHLSNVSNLEIHLNQFWNMQCLVLEDLMQSSTQFIFLQNTFYCNCSVFWLVNAVGQVKFPTLIEKNRCHGPEAFVNKSKLSLVTPAELGCPGMPIDREPTCIESSIRPNPKCPELVDGVFTSITDQKGDGAGEGGGAMTITHQLPLIIAAGITTIILKTTLI